MPDPAAPTAPAELTIAGHTGDLAAYRWEPAGAATQVILLAHGYGEHARRYDAVAARLAAEGAAVYAVDHLGHGRSPGERVLITDFEPVGTDLHLLHERAGADHPGLPVFLIGHSMGGMIGARYGQRYGRELAAVVLSGPLIGPASLVTELLKLDEIPDAPLDPAALSRDPEVGRAYAADPLVWHGPFKRPTLEAMAAALAAIDDGGRIGAPALWVHGGDDHIVNPAESEQGWARIRPATHAQISYPGARHEIFNETNSDAVLTDVIAFLAAHR